MKKKKKTCPLAAGFGILKEFFTFDISGRRHVRVTRTRTRYTSFLCTAARIPSPAPSPLVGAAAVSAGGACSRRGSPRLRGNLVSGNTLNGFLRED